MRGRWRSREVEAAEVLPVERRAEVWAGWLAEGRYRWQRELARAVGVCPATVNSLLRRGK